MSLGKICMGVEVFSEWGFYGSMAGLYGCRYACEAFQVGGLGGTFGFFRPRRSCSIKDTIFV